MYYVSGHSQTFCEGKGVTCYSLARDYVQAVTPLFIIIKIMSKSVIFCRVSSREQEETGYSLDAQEKLLRDYADRNELEVIKVFSVSESASGRKQRKNFEDMMKYVSKKDIKIVICEKVDRITRQLKDCVLINEWLEKDEDRQLHLVKNSLILHKNSRSQETLNWKIQVVLAENYIDNLKEEIRKGQREKISQGWLPTKPPMGYKIVERNGHKIHVIDEDYAPFIRKMFKLYATGTYSLSKLTKRMYKEGFRTRGGSKLHKSRLAEILSHPFYYGKIRWNDEIYEGKQEPLISKDLFNKVQSFMKRKNVPKYRKHNHLFKGMINCDCCGRSITWEKQKQFIYGHCTNSQKCSNDNWIREDKLEKQVLPAFKRLQINNKKILEWVRKALKEGQKSKVEYHTTALNSLNSQYKQIQKRIDNLYDDKVDEKISEEFYNRKFKQYKKERGNVLESIKKHEKASDSYQELGLNIYELSQKSTIIYSKANINQKKRLFNLVFDDLKLNEGKLLYSYQKHIEILYKAVKATNSSELSKIMKNHKGNSEQPEIVSIEALRDNNREIRNGKSRGQDSNP